MVQRFFLLVEGVLCEILNYEFTAFSLPFLKLGSIVGRWKAIEGGWFGKRRP